MLYIIILLIVYALYIAIKIIVYNRTSYKSITHNSYFTTIHDKGKRGEYEIYRNLKKYEKQGCKFLFNIYLPKANDNTTELDVLMICPEAVFVFESKNYSGWIFGNDAQKTWTQVLPTGKGKGKSQKDHFYNPVWQNKAHCDALKAYLPPEVIIKSVIVFSNRCTFKDVKINNTDVFVVHRREISTLIKGFINTDQGSHLDVNQIYEKLYPYSQVSDEVKQNHIDELNTYK